MFRKKEHSISSKSYYISSRRRKRRRRKVRNNLQNDKFFQLTLRALSSREEEKKEKRKKGDRIFAWPRYRLRIFGLFSNNGGSDSDSLSRGKSKRRNNGPPFIQNRVAPSKRAPVLHTKRLESHGYYLLEYIQTSFFLLPLPIRKRISKQDDVYLLPFLFFLSILSSLFYHPSFFFRPEASGMCISVVSIKLEIGGRGGEEQVHVETDARGNNRMGPCISGRMVGPKNGTGRGHNRGQRYKRIWMELSNKL